MVDQPPRGPLKERRFRAKRAALFCVEAEINKYFPISQAVRGPTFDLPRKLSFQATEDAKRIAVVSVALPSSHQLLSPIESRDPVVWNSSNRQVRIEPWNPNSEVAKSSPGPRSNQSKVAHVAQSAKPRPSGSYSPLKRLLRS